MALIPLLGCERGFQTFQGKVSNTGPALGRWSATPQGCSRDPTDGKPVGSTASIVTFYWEDPADHDERLRNQAAKRAPDVPQQLDLLRDGDGFAARMKTVKTAGYRLDRSNCSELWVESSEEPTLYDGGKPTLRGHVQMTCELQGSQLTANLAFRRCEY